jgi:hypothetical protein
MFRIPDFFQTSFPPTKAIQAGLGILLNVCTGLQSICRYRYDIQANQEAKGVISNCDVLADLLESIEHVVDRLRIYTDVSPTSAIDKGVVELILELISTLAFATRKLKQRRFREFLFTNVLLA